MTVNNGSPRPYIMVNGYPPKNKNLTTTTTTIKQHASDDDEGEKEKRKKKIYTIIRGWLVNY